MNKESDVSYGKGNHCCIDCYSTYAASALVFSIQNTESLPLHQLLTAQRRVIVTINKRQFLAVSVGKNENI
jgi:hypothetical protein